MSIWGILFKPHRASQVRDVIKRFIVNSKGDFIMALMVSKTYKLFHQMTSWVAGPGFVSRMNEVHWSWCIDQIRHRPTVDPICERLWWQLNLLSIQCICPPTFSEKEYAHYFIKRSKVVVVLHNAIHFKLNKYMVPFDRGERWLLILYQ